MKKAALNLVLFFSVTVGSFVVSTQALAAPSYYYGPMKTEKSVPEKEGKFVVLSGNNWEARSIFPSDKEYVLNVIRALGENDHHKHSVVYLYDQEKSENPLWLAEKWFDRNQKRIYQDEGNTKQGPYQWLRYKTKNNHSGIIAVERMPRGAFYPKEQAPLLEFYKELGTMTYDEKNTEEKLTGPYRVIADHAMIQFRILPDLNHGGPLEQAALHDILETVTRFFHKMSQDHCAPWYPTDQHEHKPSVSFCYTAKPDDSSYPAAGFAKSTLEIFQELYPPLMRESTKVVYHKNFSDCQTLDEDSSLEQVLHN